MKTQQSITSLPASPADDRRRRMIQYSITQAIRVICVFLLFVVHGWWLLLVAAGAILLPYIAVVLANNIGGGLKPDVIRPGAIVPVRSQPDPARQTPEPPNGEPGHGESGTVGPAAGTTASSAGPRE
jgi:hypothetical protein